MCGWKESLLPILMGIRTQTNSETKLSAAELMFGIQFRFQLEVENTPSADSYLREFEGSLINAIRNLIKRDSISSTKNKDKFEIGEKVLLLRRELRNSLLKTEEVFPSFYHKKRLGSWGNAIVNSPPFAALNIVTNKFGWGQTKL
ncbi:hypothetical protein BB561_002728 [Smittium simulii]|uniref:Uncharacterized protein n=1 Tax=Smittium simulii TaxID=133385 RepID=A0A2T9YPK2_9FUNG|nr:hypothetical protein BB561_002728 [Smittium simulii]